MKDSNGECSPRDYPHCGAGVPVALLQREQESADEKLAALTARLDKIEALLTELITSLRAFRLVVGGILAAGSLIVALAKGWSPGGK